jgi:phosphoglycerate dehydrogenase-like enzyme
VRVWVPLEEIAAAISDLPGVEVDVFDSAMLAVGDGAGGVGGDAGNAAAGMGGAGGVGGDAGSAAAGMGGAGGVGGDAGNAAAGMGGAGIAAAGGAMGGAGIGGTGIDEVEFYVPDFFLSANSIAVMARMPKLRVVQTQTAGVDPLVPHMPPGAILCNARGAHDAGTAEWVLTAILTILRDFPRFAREQAAGHWDYRPTDCLDGKTVLIIGHGSIGATVEKLLGGFEIKVCRVAKNARPGVAAVSELDALLPAADVVVVLAPVTPDTVGMVDARFLGLMRDGALLVNAARGSLVVTDALLGELRRGRLRAALDVTDPEPLPRDHPLWSAPNVLITPHVAGSTPASRRRILRLIRAQILRYMRGEPLENVISGAY